MTQGQKILITGGIRGGKSRHALSMAQAVEGKRIFLATAKASDEEMELRIKRHQKERGNAFDTIEEPLHLDQRITEHSDADVILIDCLTLWVHNLMQAVGEDHQQIVDKQESLLEVIRQSRSTIILVTNEVGWGIIPDNALARRFMDELGFLNQRLAQVCDEVIVMVAGIPQKIK